MEKFSRVTSLVMPLCIRDIDTDMIIPAQFLTSTSREGYGQNLFRRMSEANPAFPLNDPRFAQSSIILADHNFGCGSSREHAVWALLDRGFRVVISSSFADIFSSNAAKNGLVLVTLSEAEIRKLFSLCSGQELTLSVDLENQQVALPDGAVLSFHFDAFRKHCILNGLDDFDYLLSKKPEINKFFTAKEKSRFFTTLKPNN